MYSFNGRSKLKNHDLIRHIRSHWQHKFDYEWWWQNNKKPLWIGWDKKTVAEDLRISDSRAAKKTYWTLAEKGFTAKVVLLDE